MVRYEDTVFGDPSEDDRLDAGVAEFLICMKSFAQDLLDHRNGYLAVILTIS